MRVLHSANRNLRDFLSPRSSEVKFFNTLHSYGQVISGTRQLFAPGREIWKVGEKVGRGS